VKIFRVSSKVDVQKCIGKLEPQENGQNVSVSPMFSIRNLTFYAKPRKIGRSNHSGAQEKVARVAVRGLLTQPASDAAQKPDTNSSFRALGPTDRQEMSPEHSLGRGWTDETNHVD
jgi:hypothetical protein